MIWKPAGYAKWGVKLLMTEMFVPGGTLIVLAILLAGRFSPAMLGKVRALIPFQRKDRRLTPVSDPMASEALRKLE